MRTLRVLAAAAAVSLSAAPALRAQRDAVIGVGPISHIGVAVADVDAAAKAYADVFGVPQPAVNEKLSLASPTGGPAAIARVATLALPNFLIELQQFKSEYGPIYDLVREFGPTVHHISFTVDQPFGDMRGRLLQHGGRWTGGTPTTSWSYVDFRTVLGATFEPIARPVHDMLSRQWKAAPLTGTFRDHPVAGIGIVVRNVDAAARAYSDVLGIPMPQIRKQGRLRVARWTHDNGVAIELDEPKSGAKPWSQALERQHGNAVQRLIFDVGTDFAETIRQLQAKGGVIIYGSAKGPSAYVDFTKTLGLVLEVSRRPA